MAVDEKRLKINRVLDFINNELMSGKGADFKASVAQLADLTNFSERTFNRVFPQYLSDSFTKYQSTIRLEYGAHLLKTTQMSVIDVADRVGYSASSSFNKEFKKRFQITPRQYREQSQLLPNERLILDYTKVVLPETHFIYTSAFTNYDSCATAQFEEENWDFLETKAQSIGIALTEPTFWGICFDDAELRPEDQCRYYACIAVKNPPLNNQSKINVITINTGKYARFTHQGSYQSLDAFYHTIYRFFMFTDELELRSGWVLEKYINSPTEVNEEALLTELYFPIR